MNAHLRQFIHALRSGEFSQSIGRLRHEDSFCAHGVACELYRRETGIGHWHRFDFTVDGRKLYLDSMPEVVADWLDLSSTVRYDLIVMNDEDCLSFDEIANWIERELQEPVVMEAPSLEVVLVPSGGEKVAA